MSPSNPWGGCTAVQAWWQQPIDAAFRFGVFGVRSGRFLPLLFSSNAVLTTTALCAAFSGTMSARAEPQVDQSDPSFARGMSEPSAADLAQLGIAAADAFVLDFPATAGGTFTLAIPIEGVIESIELIPTSVRAPDYKLIVQGPDGEYAEMEPSPEQSYRGAIAGIPGALVAATRYDDGFRVNLLMSDGTRFWVEPAPMIAAAGLPGLHVMYRDDDVLSGERSCLPAERAMKDSRLSGQGRVAAEGIRFAELAIDADYEYYERYGSVQAVESQVASIINALNVQYERDLMIRHTISAVIVRTAEPDPYSSSDASSLLDQLRWQWINNHSSVARDVTQLFTGKSLNGTTIGIAWRGEICSTFAYSLVESNAVGCESFACKTDLSAHELGHNWGADHCPCATPFPGYTMNAVITNANRFHPTYDIPEMIAYRDSLSCLDLGDDLRRLVVSVASTSLNAGQSIQLTATADFRYGPDQNVTSQTDWSVDRPDLAVISPSGMLTALDADGESCVRVDASYTYLDQTRVTQKSFSFFDPSDPLKIVSSDPPNNAIDARRPSDADGSNPVGWSSIELTLNGEPCSLSPPRFEVTKLGGSLPPPTVASVTPLGSNAVRVALIGSIEPGAWTTVRDTVSGVSTRVGFLPGDVSGDGTVGPSDILSLIDTLNGVGPTLPIWATDIDRSGLAAPADILTLIDLFNGANAFHPWNGATLP